MVGLRVGRGVRGEGGVAVGSGGIRRSVMLDPRDLSIHQSEGSIGFDDVMTM